MSEGQSGSNTELDNTVLVPAAYPIPAQEEDTAEIERTAENLVERDRKLFLLALYKQARRREELTTSFDDFIHIVESAKVPKNLFLIPKINRILSSVRGLLTFGPIYELGGSEILKRGREAHINRYTSRSAAGITVTESDGIMSIERVTGGGERIALVEEDATAKEFRDLSAEIPELIAAIQDIVDKLGESLTDNDLIQKTTEGLLNRTGQDLAILESTISNALLAKKQALLDEISITDVTDDFDREFITNVLLELSRREHGISLLERFEENLAKRQTYEQATEALQKTDLIGEINARRELLSLLTSTSEKNAASSIASTLLAKGDAAADNDAVKMFGHQEDHVVFTGFLLAPTWSTKEFSIWTRRLFEASRTAENEELVRNSEKINANNISEWLFRTQLTKALAERTCESWKGKKVMEIGGTDTAEVLGLLGAQVEKEADAGYEESLEGYFPGTRENMIELKNYRDFAVAHNVDAVIFSQVLETGSGVHYIAELEYGQNPYENTRLAIEEMTLVTSNLLRHDGFVLTDHGLTGQDSYGFGRPYYEAVGFEHQGTVRELPYSGHCNIYRLKGEPTVKEVKIGRKRAIYDEQSQTWEIKSL